MSEASLHIVRWLFVGAPGSAVSSLLNSHQKKSSTM